MGFNKFNKGSQFTPINTEGYEYKKPDELFETYGEDTTYPIRALYVNDTKFGESAVATTDGYFINLPTHIVNDVKEIIADENLVNMINEGRVSISLYEYFSSKYKGTFYGVKWVESEPVDTDDIPF